MELECKPGLFIGVVKKQQWHDRVSHLTGDDLHDFKEKCNPFREAKHTSLVKSIGIGIHELHYVCKYLDPDFNLDEDFYTVRIAPQKSKP